MNQWKLDKTAFSVGTLNDEGDDRAYWQSLTPMERLSVLEFNRQLNYGYNPTTERLQRVFEVAQLKKD